MYFIQLIKIFADQLFYSFPFLTFMLKLLMEYLTEKLLKVFRKLSHDLLFMYIVTLQFYFIQKSKSFFFNFFIKVIKTTKSNNLKNCINQLIIRQNLNFKLAPKNMQRGMKRKFCITIKLMMLDQQDLGHYTTFESIIVPNL